MSQRQNPGRRPLASSPFAGRQDAERPAIEVAVNDRVTHEKHGMGRVIQVDETTCVVDFGAQKRRINLRGSKLEKL